jgi:riboflavin kinase/FMN adenylyltransferase
MVTSLEQRLEAFAESGVDVVAVLDFSQVRTMDPGEFVGTIVSGVMRAAYVAVGAGFRFGYRMTGDEVILRQLGDTFGFAVEIVDLLSLQSPVSSTMIRQELDDGDVAGAAAMLGRPFQLRGGVVAGDRRGRQLGFPTANLEIESLRAIPGRGVYSALTATTDGTVYPAVVNVGVRPTFGGRAEVVEVHLLDQNLDLYGQELSVDFVQRIRPERRFDGVDELVEQIGRDIATARSQLAEHQAR